MKAYYARPRLEVVVEPTVEETPDIAFVVLAGRYGHGTDMDVHVLAVAVCAERAAAAAAAWRQDQDDLTGHYGWWEVRPGEWAQRGSQLFVRIVPHLIDDAELPVNQITELARLG